jgi:hypothetical protein
VGVVVAVIFHCFSFVCPVGRFFLSVQSEAKEKTDHRETKRNEGGRGGRTERRAGQVTNGFIVWRAAVLSRRAVPKRSPSPVGVEKERAAKRIRAVGFALQNQANGTAENRSSDMSTKIDGNQHTAGTHGKSQRWRAWHWRLTDSQSARNTGSPIVPL